MGLFPLLTDRRELSPHLFWLSAASQGAKSSPVAGSASGISQGQVPLGLGNFCLEDGAAGVFSIPFILLPHCLLCSLLAYPRLVVKCIGINLGAGNSCLEGLGNVWIQGCHLIPYLGSQPAPGWFFWICQTHIWELRAGRGWQAQKQLGALERGLWRAHACRFLCGQGKSFKCHGPQCCYH